MRKVFFILVSLVSSNSFAINGKELGSFKCASNDGSVAISGTKIACTDVRYQQWQKNGCYMVRVTKSDEVIALEMVRNVPFRLEQQQNFYSLMTFDAMGWVLQGMALEMTTDSAVARFRYDTRKKNPDPFISVYGRCELVSEK